MKRICTIIVLSLLILLVNASADADAFGNYFTFYVVDNKNSAPIHAAEVRINGTSVCITTDGVCKKNLEYSNGERVLVTVIADDYVNLNLTTSIYSDGDNYIAMRRKPRPRAISLSGFGPSDFFSAAFVSYQNSRGRDVPISFSVLVQDVASVRIPNADISVTDRDGTIKTGKTDRNGLYKFKKTSERKDTDIRHC